MFPEKKDLCSVLELGNRIMIYFYAIKQLRLSKIYLCSELFKRKKIEIFPNLAALRSLISNKEVVYFMVKLRL